MNAPNTAVPLWSVLLWVLGPFLSSPGLVSGQSGVADLPCREQLLTDFSSLNPLARGALEECVQPLNDEDRAACVVLRGLESLTSRDQESAFELFREALAVYEESEDHWGSWIVHVLMGGWAQPREGHGSLAESHLTNALKSLDNLEDTEKALPARSLRLFAEVFRPPDIALTIMETIPVFLTRGLLDFASSSTHYLLGISQGCDQRIEEAELNMSRSLSIIESNPDIFDESKVRTYLAWLRHRSDAPVASEHQAEKSTERIDPSTTTGGLVVDWLYSSMYRDFCRAPRLFLYEYVMNPRANAAHESCEKAANEHEQAACDVLEGLKHLTDGNADSALQYFRMALVIYERSQDHWGAWVVHILSAISAKARENDDDADFHLQEALALLGILEKEQATSPNRSLRLVGELGNLNGEMIPLIEAMPDYFRPLFSKAAAADTHYFLGFHRGCQQQLDQAKEHLRLYWSNSHYDTEVYENESSEPNAMSGSFPAASAQTESTRIPSAFDSLTTLQVPLPFGGFCSIVETQRHSFYHRRTPSLENRCRAPIDRHESAICSVLRGADLLEYDGEAAHKAFQEALPVFRDHDDTLGLSIVYLLMGVAELAENNQRSAEAHLGDALNILSTIEVREGSVRISTVRLLGELLGFPEALLKAIEATPETWASALVAATVARIRLILVVELGCQRRFREAEMQLREILAISDERSIASALLHELLALVHIEEGSRDVAAVDLREALSVSRWLKNTEKALSVSALLRHLFSSMNRFDDAVELNDEALEIAGPDPSFRSLLLVERGMIYARDGRIAESRNALAEAADVAEGSDIPLFKEGVLLIVGQRLTALRFFKDAVAALKEVVGLLHPPSPGNRERWILESARLNLVWAYDSLGLHELAGAEMGELRKLVENSGRRVLLHLAEIALSEGELDKSIEAFRQAAEAMEGDPHFRHLSRDFQVMYEILERVQGAVTPEDFFDALLRPDISTGVGRGLALLQSIFEHWKHGRESEAKRELREFFQENLASFHLTRLEEANALMAVALTWLEDNLDTAVSKSKQAIEIFESYLDEMHAGEVSSGLIDNLGHDLYHHAVEILAQVSAEEAFSYAERGRAWALRRLLGSARLGMRKPDSRELEILAEISELEREWREGSSDEETRLHELDSLREEYGRLRTQNILIDDNNSDSEPVEPITLDRLQREVLNPDTTLLAYYPGTEKIWVWTVDRQEIEMTAIPMPRVRLLRPAPEERWQELGCEIQALRTQGRSPRAAKSAKARGVRLIPGCGIEDDPSVSLFKTLIEPVKAHLKHRHLIVVPYGILHHLPFAALRDPDTGRYLVQDFTLSVAPSATSLELLSRPAGLVEGESLVLGDPAIPLWSRLAGARREAEVVADLLGTAAYLREQATERVVFERAGRLRVLHLAVHGQHVPESPLFSRMLLVSDGGNDGALEMHEVLDRLDLSGAELVVLSGCDTSLGALTRGDEVIGLPRAFFAAGSRAVISTLWPVDDVASAELMEGFYRRYVVDGATAAEALRGAQSEMLGKEDRPPYFWAGYNLIGDPNARWRLNPIQAVPTPQNLFCEEQERLFFTTPLEPRALAALERCTQPVDVQERAVPIEIDQEDQKCLRKTSVRASCLLPW